jgi:DNA-binding transcriptional ArsR family regulator
MMSVATAAAPEVPVATKDPLQPQRCAELLSALAAPERLRIVRFLADGPHNVTEIADMLGIPAVNVSHHLTVLKHAKLIRGKKQGRFVLYSLEPGVLEEAVGAGVPKDALNLGCCRIELPLGDSQPGEC